MSLLERVKKRRGDNMQRPPLTVQIGEQKHPWSIPAQVATSLRYMLLRISQHQPLPSRLALLSATRGEGVSYLSNALGVVLANDFGVSVLVVGLNWWWPSPIPGPDTIGTGLANVLSGEATLKEVVQPTGLPNLALLPAGELPEPQRPIMARSAKLREIIMELTNYYDHLILDIPAVRATSDAVPLASLADGCCLVVRQGTTPLEQIRLGLDEVQHLPMLGVVLNEFEAATPAWLLKLIPQ